MIWLASSIAVAITLAIWFSVPAFQRFAHNFWYAYELSSRPPKAYPRRAAWFSKHLTPEFVTFALALLLASIPTLIHSAPLPVESDEYSYLLAADTFAHGRLTNPPHPMADMLETAEVIQSPTYASKYPPAQGFFLAIGLKLLNLPIAGAWLSGALACAAITWMLRGFLPPGQSRWALLGGILAASHPLFEWWNNCYWGGNVAALGGALLLGSAARIFRSNSRAPNIARENSVISDRAFTGEPSPLPSPGVPGEGVVCSSMVAGVALSILALSRPFEGAIVAIIVILALTLMRAISVRVILYALLTLAPGLIFLGYYNHRVTGDWLLMPHALHERQYLIAPRFFWQSPRTDIQFHSQVMHDFATIELHEYQQELGVRKFLSFAMLKLGRLIANYDFPPTLLLATLAGAIAARRKSFLRLALAVVVLLPAIHLSMLPITRVPYFAPLIGALFVLIISGARWLSDRGIPAELIAICLLVGQISAFIVRVPQLEELSHPKIAQARAADLAMLRAQPGKQLVLVRYPPGKPPIADFVKNDADIDRSKVVCARSIDADHDRQLLEYFHDRKPWLFVGSETGYALRPLRAEDVPR